MQYRQDLHDLIEPAVLAVGYQLLGIQLVQQGKRVVLRVYIDRPEGITVDDCEIVSKQISAVLDVEEPLRERYTLEVSSPGIERPLFTAEHYRQAEGQKVQITLRFALDGQKKFLGVINQVQEGKVILQAEDKVIALPLADIAKGHLVANYEGKKSW